LTIEGEAREIRRMKFIFLFVTTMGALLLGVSHLVAQNTLMLEAKIQLGHSRGRIDHMAVDLARHWLFVAQLENDSVGVIDLQTREIAHVITDVKGPQGLAYVAFTDTLFVANDGDGSLRMFQGEQYRAVARIDLGEDADNIRFDAKTNHVVVSYGNG
jgi:DNA-binding beta-propeller fold protein YncE